MNTFYQVFVPYRVSNNKFIWYILKSYHSKAYAVKVMSQKFSCFAVVSNPYPFCDECLKKVYIYGDMSNFSNLTLDRFSRTKKIINIGG